MAVVYIYGGSGKFNGQTAFEWECPEIGNIHKFIFFMLQEEDIPQPERAIKEISLYGFSIIDLTEGNQIATETLNEPRMKIFQKHYEGAFSEGSSLAWYP